MKHIGIILSFLVIHLVMFIATSCDTTFSVSDILAEKDIYAYAENSVNAPSFRKNSICTWKNFHFAAYYSADGYVNLIRWDDNNPGKITTEKMDYKGKISDAHNVISMIADGDGYLHLACDHHNNQLHYFQGIEPGALNLKPAEMVGVKEDKMTYPEFYKLANGNLIFLYRDGGSGNGDMVVNQYDIRTKQWKRLHDNLIDGEGKRNAYWQFSAGPDGILHVSWVWRESPDVATNHDLCYARSRDGGVTWEKSSGQEYQLPIREATAEVVWKIPQKSELMNQTAIAGGENGICATATYWRDSDSEIPNYRIVWFDGKSWHAEVPYQRKTPFTLSGTGSKRVPISRPQIMLRQQKQGIIQAIMVFRDEEFGSKPSIAVCNNLGKEPWTIKHLSKESLGHWEPTFDSQLWNEQHVLSVFALRVGQGDGETTEKIPPQKLHILNVKL